MYHRYIPKPNGTYERQLVEERPVLRSEPCPPPAAPQPACQPTPQPCQKQIGGTSLLGRLLPRDLDWGDLLVLAILLLLLVESGEDDQLSILLAVAAFMFL